MAGGSVDRADVIRYRIRAQQLDRPEEPRPFTDAAILDLGVQDTGRDGASWALANRGVPVRGPGELNAAPDIALAWTLRSAPHFYRRTELPDVMVATSPLSERDAVKRVFGAAKPLGEAGITTLNGLAEVAAGLRAVVSEPLPKGEVSTRLSQRLDPVYLRNCVPCKAVHSWEVPFRIGALYGGLELEPGTSPPVLRRIPNWPRRRPGPAPDPSAAAERLQPIRGYLRFLGPAAPNDVAAFLDAPVAEVKKHWPADASEVTVDGSKRWLLDDPGSAGAEAADADPDLLRLLGPYDLFIQGRDRSLILPDKGKHKSLWPILGRPGAVLAGTEIAGIWRPQASGSTFTLRVDLWSRLDKPARARLEAEAERLAAHRGLTLAGIEKIA
jgi:Winged helix DNA-binding domain